MRTSAPAGPMTWIKAADIQPSMIKGSDHPLLVDLHDEIITDADDGIALLT